jgi:NarL family two-component system response regulator LiaR
MITVLLADDHALVRHGVRSFLATQPDLDVVAEAATGAETVRQAAEHRPDVALVDLRMPATDGVEAIRQLARTSPTTRVVVLTSYEADADVLPALRAGALSYLLKDAGPEELAEAVRAAARGQAVLHPRVATRVVATLHGPRGEVPDGFRELTDRELEVLRLLAEGLSNREVAARLVIGEKTVKTHVSAILAKLGLADRAQATAYAWRHGVLRRETEN